jgi:hypothetical protein
LRNIEVDLSPEVLLIPPQLYTSLLLEDIQNTPSPPPVSLPACVARACSILEANPNLNFKTYEGSNSRVWVIVYDVMMESSLHKFETVDRGGPNMEEQESS